MGYRFSPLFNESFRVSSRIAIWLRTIYTRTTIPGSDDSFTKLLISMRMVEHMLVDTVQLEPFKDNAEHRYARLIVQQRLNRTWPIPIIFFKSTIALVSEQD